MCLFIYSIFLVQHLLSVHCVIIKTKAHIYRTLTVCSALVLISALYALVHFSGSHELGIIITSILQVRNGGMGVNFPPT